MGSTDGRDRDPLSWANTGGDGGTAYFLNDWYGRLFKGQRVDAAGALYVVDVAYGRVYRIEPG